MLRELVVCGWFGHGEQLDEIHQLLGFIKAESLHL